MKSLFLDLGTADKSPVLEAACWEELDEPPLLEGVCLEEAQAGEEQLMDQDRRGRGAFPGFLPSTRPAG